MTTGRDREYSQSDTPEDLLDGTGESLGGVLGLGSGETDKLSTGEREGGGDEDGAETTEAVLESSRVVPQSVTPVLAELAIGGTTTADEDEGNEHEDDDGSELEAGTPELLLGVAQSTKDVDDDGDDPEERDPDCITYFLVPVLDGEGADSKFERKDDEPLEDLQMLLVTRLTCN